MLEFRSLTGKRQRAYKSATRERQAAETRHRIVTAAHRLLRTAGFSGMTIEAVAKRAQVSVPSVYAHFKSKTGILTALLDESMFGSDYDQIVRQAQGETDPETRLRRSAAVARQIRSAQSAAFDLLRGAGVVAPELAKLQRDRESLRYDGVESVITFLRKSAKLRPGPIVVHVDSQWVTVCTKLVHEPAVTFDHEVGLPVTALDVRVEPQEPAGVNNGAGAVRQARSKSFHQFGHGDETVPGRAIGNGPKLVGLDVDPPDRRDHLHAE